MSDRSSVSSNIDMTWREQERKADCRTLTRALSSVPDQLSRSHALYLESIRPHLRCGSPEMLPLCKTTSLSRESRKLNFYGFKLIFADRFVKALI